LNLPDIDSAHYDQAGIKVRLANKIIHVGSTRFMELCGMAIPAEMQMIQQRAHENGISLVMVAIDNKLRGAIELSPVIRPEAKEIIRVLRERQISMYIISGDSEAPTKQLAQELGIENYFAETLPENTTLRVPLGESQAGCATARRRQISLFSPKGTRSAVSVTASMTR